MAIAKSCQLFFKPKHASFLRNLLIDNMIPLEEIYAHPFNQQLLKGTLSKAVFGRYLRDDYVYLQDYSIALQRLSLRAQTTHPDLAQRLKHLGQDIVKGEQEMQRRYKEHQVGSPHHQPGAAIRAYTRYLTKTTTDAPLAVGLISILPCFEIYRKIGVIAQSHAPLTKKYNPYNPWIATYSSQDFIKTTLQLSDTVDQIGNQSPPELQTQMKEAFKNSVQYERSFFDEVCSLVLDDNPRMSLKA